MKPELLSAFRMINGISQQAMADRLNVSQALITKIERGERVMSEDIRKRIASEFGVNSDIMRQIERLKEALNTVNLQD